MYYYLSKNKSCLKQDLPCLVTETQEFLFQKKILISSQDHQRFATGIRFDLSSIAKTLTLNRSYPLNLISILSA